tara:strand:- start:191 stop:343 length:153 start_codon:yes stop_codon:yes gene_type:complete
VKVFEGEFATPISSENTPPITDIDELPSDGAVHVAVYVSAVIAVKSEIAQ